MALRLRRGTNTERQTATFAEGELIYVTDYESAGVSPLWIGDGSTVGGNEVETGGTPSLALNDLTDVNAVGIENNVLVYQGSQWTSVDPSTLGISGSGIVEGQEYNISINGGVIGNDSTVIVDNITQVVTANLFVGSGAGLTDINLVDLDDVFAFGAEINDVLTYDGTGWIPAKPASLLEGIEYNINIQGNVIGLDSSTLLDAATNTLNGNVFGNVTGNLNGVVDGQLLGSVFTDNSTIIVDGITGDLYPNRIISTNNLLEFINNDVGSINEVEVLTNDQRSVLSLSRLSDVTTLNNPLTPYGSLFFKRKDLATNNAVVTGVIAGFNNRIVLTSDSTSLYPQSGYVTIFEGGLLGIGTEFPNEKLEVHGNAVIFGNVTAAAFKGTFVGDDSTTIIDGIEGTVTASGYIQFGSYTSVNRPSGVNGMVIYNSTVNRFQGFQNGSWINLDDGTSA